MAEPVKPLDDLGQHIKERLSIGVIDIDALQGISAGGDVIDSPRNSIRNGLAMRSLYHR